jgi:acyl-CoA thioester hydrolase
MDAYNHVNNSVYFTYFESARIAWWQSITPPTFSFQQQGPVIINASATFVKAIIFPETLLIKLYVGPAGRSSHECYYEIYSKNAPDVLYASGSTKVVWVDRTLERSIPLPDFIRQHLPISE